MTDYIFVASEPQAGSKIITSPLTGKEWLVTAQGNWIADEFERDDKCLKITIPRYCFKTRSTIETKIYLTNPSFRQLENMPMD